MKKMMILLILCYCNNCFSQDTALNKLTKYEEFSSEDGILKKIQIKKIGKIKGFDMAKMVVTNVETGKFLNAVEITEKATFWVPTYGASILLDEDELPPLIKVLKYFQQNVVTDNCKEECPYFRYETNGGVTIKVEKRSGGFSSNWHIYLVRSRSVIDLDVKELELLIKLLEDYK